MCVSVLWSGSGSGFTLVDFFPLHSRPLRWCPWPLPALHKVVMLCHIRFGFGFSKTGFLIPKSGVSDLGLEHRLHCYLLDRMPSSSAPVPAGSLRRAGPFVLSHVPYRS